ncbi:MAG: 16S rRNA (cytosine(1402)-N(4))-methyltransferase RsmH [Actinomyces sp.]|uniref:16S rRNA (cytosine(1402)-N(4))-methyltransferase RsmH n=1 Tax=Actinomyces sp. TaxID=29317 RepID=UPI0026DAD433|nr:16S rRNA (cytosine(1402)-N(4))-methyltransferase RsmH [Actinomyces sp.]MDO4243890.1 16S rRNA (cytosine(1402)-N(4))-methyltransferase RsmH [Actinomyces sp.]
MSPTRTSRARGTTGDTVVPVAEAAAPASRRHIPVLLERCLELLAPALAPQDGDGPVLIDCTLGMGGHTEAALERFPGLRVVGIDRDPQAIALAGERLARFGPRFSAVQTTYDHVDEVARSASVRQDGTVDAILMDLGVSSLQLDEVDRGFSYARSAPLDMRMDQSGGMTAQELLDTAEERELVRILRSYGEERFAPRIASALVRRRRAGEPVTTTDELVELVRAAVPAAARRTGGNPAKRTFQALRIAVNAELEVLELAVPRALNSLRVGGRLVVESYQSLEDRVVKQALAAGATARAPQDLPVVPAQARPYLELLTRGAERADAAEQSANPRSASVRLRAAARTRPAAQAPAPGAEHRAQGAQQTSKNHRGRTPR